MPAGLLLSLTAWTADRPRDEALTASLPPAAGSHSSRAGTTSGPLREGIVGAVPFSVTRCSLSGCDAFRSHAGPKAVFPPAHPRSGESEDALGTSRPLAQFQATFAPPSIRVLPPALLTSPSPVKARPQDTPSPPRSRYGFRPLPGEIRLLPALFPLSWEYRSRRLPATCSPCRNLSSSCFSSAGPPSQRCVRPAPSRPEDCALNQHFSSHLGTFVQRKMIL